MLDPSLFPDLTARELESAPIARAETIPSAWYTEPRFHELDREAVLAASWQHVGDLAQVREPGGSIAAEVAGNPVLVVRGDDGELRAFYNVCRHRGGPLGVKAGTKLMLQCRYHGWTYEPDGMLRGVPHFNRTELFDKRDYGLVPVRLAVWEGHVFVSLAPTPQPLEECLEGIRERLAPQRLGDLTFARQVEYDVRCNWKVYVDNYLEGYHVPYVHPELFEMYDFEAYRTEVRDRYTVQVGPLAAGKTVYSEGGGEALYYHVFPNFMLNVLPGRLQTNVVVPLAPDRCRVVFRYYYDDVSSAAARERIDADLAFSDHVQQEDMEICARVQLGISSRAYQRGRFSPTFEEGVYRFQCLLKEAYREWLIESPRSPPCSP